jgi:hypothetical protein
MAAALLVLVVFAWLGAVAGVAGVMVIAWLLGQRPPRRRSRAPRRPAGFQVSGSRVRVVEFQGYVYFDGAKQLLGEVIREAAASAEQMGFLVLDFRGAIGAERSAAATLARLQRLLAARGVAVVYTGMGSTMQRLLQRAGCEFTVPGGHAAEDLRRGLAWCDRQGRTYAGDMRLLELFRANTGDRWLLPQLLGRCEAHDLPAGAMVLRSDESGAIFFVERGSLSAWQDLGDGDRLLLRTLGPGALASGSVLHPGADLHPVVVLCDTPTRVHRLSEAVRKEMEAEDPFLAAALARMVVGLANERTPPRAGSRGRGIVHRLNSSAGLYRGAAATSGRSGPG